MGWSGQQTGGLGGGRRWNGVARGMLRGEDGNVVLGMPLDPIGEESGLGRFRGFLRLSGSFGT